jgi:hypothetical protein
VLVHTNAWCPRRHGCCWRGHGSASGGRLCSACSFVHVLLLALLGCALVARVCSAAALPPWFLCTHQDGAGFEPTGCTRGLRSPQAAAPGVNPHPPPLTNGGVRATTVDRAGAAAEHGRPRKTEGSALELVRDLTWPKLAPCQHCICPDCPRHFSPLEKNATRRCSLITEICPQGKCPHELARHRGRAPPPRCRALEPAGVATLATRGPTPRTGARLGRARERGRANPRGERARECERHALRACSGELAARRR